MLRRLPAGNACACDWRPTTKLHCKQPNDPAAAGFLRPRLHPTPMRSTARPGAGKSGTPSGRQQAFGRQPLGMHRGELEEERT